MGDYFSPKRRDVVDRLRRRIEVYRRRQNGCHQRYEFGQKTIYDQQKQTALFLRQKWLDSKAKKTSKSKTKSDSSHPDHRNQIVTKRLKSKVDSNLDSQNQTQGQGHAESVYRFDDDEPVAKQPKTSNTTTNIEGPLSSVSVHIVHQINSGNTQQEPKISTNVTVNSTIKSPSNQEADLKTNVECKQEPGDESFTKGANQSNDSQDSNAEFGSDIEDILKSFEDAGEIPQDIIAELDKFDKIYKSVQDSETNDSSLNSSSEKESMFSQGMYVDPAAQGHGQVRTPPMQSYRANTAGQPHVPVSSMSEGGLAAETLKQMAAQHQQEHTGQEQFGVKSAIDPFSDIPETGQFNQRNGYPSEYQYSGQRPPSGGTFNGQQCLGYPNKPSVPPYGVSKPLNHYPHTQSESGPSSLQQLQNQVAHFNQGPQMEITQTQHMQLSDGSHRMQLSQTQQIQLRQPVHNISLTQQQGFSASPNMGQTPSQNFMTNDQIALQQQMMQSKLHGDQRQQSASASHMQQYMNRPPPEYKMQHANGISSAMSANSIGTNPLQTIQNMVNQTNTHANQGYSNVKSESNDLHMQNGMRTAQMSAMQQQMTNSVNPSVGISMAQAQMQYSNQAAIQRQASYPGAMVHAQARGQRPNTPTYTSAIMRNQRPPNVNIGPDGLNISQPRAHDWPGPRGMMPVSGPTTSAGMMQYRSFSTDGQNVSAAAAAAEMRMQQQQQQSNVQMTAMQSQQAMMQGSAQAQQQMMMQQQRLQMSHQMAPRPHNTQSPSYNMASPPSSSFPQASASQEDILNLLDSAPNQSTDFYDVQTSGSGTEANWYDIEDILGNPK